MKNERYLDRKSAARYLKVGTTYFDEIVRAGLIRCIDLPNLGMNRRKRKCLRFDTKDLDDFMESRKAAFEKRETVINDCFQKVL